MKDQRSVNHRLEFGAFVLDIPRGQLLRDGAEVPLRPQSFELLCYLVRHAGRLVTREELTAAIWQGRHVTDNSLAQCIVDIRAALDDADHRLIRTVPRRGYRFDVSVSAVGDDPPGPGNSQRTWPVWLAALAIALVLLVAVGFLGGGADTRRHGEAPIVAVMSFENSAGDVLDPALVSTLRDHLSTEIARQSSLRVVSQYSIQQLEQDAFELADIRRRLGADFAVLGRIVADAPDHRLSVQLADTQRNVDIWSQSFDLGSEPESLQRLGIEIADAVVDETGLARDENGSDRNRSVTSIPDALQHFTTGRFHQRAYENHLAQEDAWESAWYRFAAAIGADPGWAPPWAGLARLKHFRIGGNPGADRQLDVEQTLWLIDHAHSLDADYGPLYESLGYVRHTWFLDWDGANAAYDEAERLGYDPTWGRAILERQRGRFDESIALYRRAVQVDPLNLALKYQLASAYACAYRFQEAVVELEELEALQPENLSFSATLALNRLYLGRDGLARRWLAENAGDFPDSPFLGLHFALLGDVVRAERALDEMTHQAYPAVMVVELAGLLGRDDWALDWLLETASADPRQLKYITCSQQARRLANDQRLAALLEQHGISMP